MARVRVRRSEVWVFLCVVGLVAGSSEAGGFVFWLCVVEREERKEGRLERKVEFHGWWVALNCICWVLDECGFGLRNFV